MAAKNSASTAENGSGDPSLGTPSACSRCFIRIKGVLRYLWRAVDQRRVVLDVFV